MDSVEWYSAKAALDWQIELGATEAIGDTPINRYDLAAAPKPVPAAVEAAPEPAVQAASAVSSDPVAISQALAGQANDLAALRLAVEGYDHCDLRNGAKTCVFCDGVPGAPVMIIGEAPGRDEDTQGRPFVGRAGQLLDKMLAAVDMSRQNNVYITNILPWRPPQNRDPKADEVAMMLPFVKRHIELAAPKVLVVMGNHACHAILGKRGITKLRGQWDQALGLPVLPMLHPAYLLRQPHAKRHAWADLLALKHKISQEA
ncbi:MAG: uracil-DNA glycosylase [Planktomarina sp.]